MMNKIKPPWESFLYVKRKKVVDICSRNRYNTIMINNNDTGKTMKVFQLIGKSLSMVTLVGMGYIGYSAQAEVTSQAILTAGHEEIECLAMNIYFESRGEAVLGQQAVAWVTLNRVNSERYPDTICEVVWQPSQFSWTHDGRSDTPHELEAWNRAQVIAEMVYYQYYNAAMDPTSGSTMFHGAHINPYWSSSYNRVVRIDNHIFYN